MLAMCVLGMLAFESKRMFVQAIGGALLAFAIATKIWPGVLLLYHLCGKRWQPLAWTAGWLGIYSVLTLAMFGVAVFRDFLGYQLPRLASGEAFAFMAAADQPLVTNMSVNAIPHKLHFLGHLAAKPPLLSPWIVWSFSGLALLLVVVAGLRHGRTPSAASAASAPSAASAASAPSAASAADRLWRMRTWLAMLALVQLRSPFLPFTYGVIATLWLLLLPLPGRGKGGTTPHVLAFAVLAVPHWTEFPGRAWHTTLGTLITLVAAAVTLLTPGRVDAGEPDGREPALAAE